MKVLDITDRLKAQEQPVLKVRDCEFSINDNAVTLLTIMELIGEGEPETADIFQAAKAIFGEEGFERLSEMKLNMENFMEVITAAMDLITGQTAGE